jgi:hypothetical protein
MNKAVQVLACQVLLGAQKYLEDQVALRRSSKTGVTDMLVEHRTLDLEFPFSLNHLVLTMLPLQF